MDQSKKKNAVPSSRDKKDEPGSDARDAGAGGEFEFDVAVLEDREDNEPYGCFGYTPEFLQFFRRQPVALLVVLCVLISASSYIQHGVFGAAVPHIQHEFTFSITDMAMIRSMYDVGALLVAIPVLLFGFGGSRRAQWMATGGVVVGFGALFVTIPHFLTPVPHHVNDTGDMVCKLHLTGATNSSATKSQDYCAEYAKFQSYKYMFMFGELLIGAGSLIPHILGIAFLDENLTHRKSALYTAIVSVCYLLGPSIGYMVAGKTLTIHGEVEKLGWAEAAKVPRDNPRWYGAWWIAMLGGVAVSWIGSALMFPYPTQLSGAVVEHIRDARRRAVISVEGYDETVSGPPQVVKTLKDIFRNYVFILAVVEVCARTFLLAGFSVFMSKYLERMFDIEASNAGLISGGGIVAAAIVGLIFGTAMQHMFHLDVAGNLRLSLAAAAIATIASGVFAVTCPQEDIVGVTIDFGFERFQGVESLDDACNRGCDCEPHKWEPFCFSPENKPETRITYFSPCTAGCGFDIERPDHNCSCIPADKGVGTPKKGACVRCSKYRLYALLVGLSWGGASMFVRMNPMFQVTLRVVDFKLRVAALAVSEAVMRITAAPSPFAMAALMHKTCAVWGKQCKLLVYCAMFQKDELSTAMLVMAIVGNAVCFISLVIAVVIYRDPRRLRLKKRPPMPKSIAKSASAKTVPSKATKSP